jgi:hypothetical protein
MTNGEFERFGCAVLPEASSRRACLRGAAEIDGPLVTFS